MQIKYIAEDGLAFDTAEECQTYEANNLMKMWNTLGERVAKAGSAKYVYLPTSRATKAFIELCDKENETHGELVSSDLGLFVWAIETECYIKLDVDELHKVIQEVRD